MHINRVTDPTRAVVFKAWRALTVALPGPRLRSFGPGADQIGGVLVVNLDRQPHRWRRVSSELGRFRASDGRPLTAVTRRIPAVDARDGRAVAATADVDPAYRIGDQLYVQPDERLAECFHEDEQIQMTRQEVAVARSHVEVWKAVASGNHEYVLVLEDDVWFVPGAARMIDRAWSAALDRASHNGGPNLLYLSYSDADGAAIRQDSCRSIFRPERGLWFLSGYVLSRAGAGMLLRAMPVVGPVDLWMNYRFAELGALALNSPAIKQRHDEVSANSYSVLPYLARAGTVDAPSPMSPSPTRQAGPVLAWTGSGESDSLAMALSMLGLRVRVFKGDEEPLDESAWRDVLTTFDAVVDAPLATSFLALVAADDRCRILLEADAPSPPEVEGWRLSPSKPATLTLDNRGQQSWAALCEFLDLPVPVEAYPAGSPRADGLFRDDRPAGRRGPRELTSSTRIRDESPWLLPPSSAWIPALSREGFDDEAGATIAETSMAEGSSWFPSITETFPGNLASFDPKRIRHGAEGALFEIDAVEGGSRPFKSGACASAQSFRHGRFQADIKAARGSGLITGFFLHRASPRQEIDIEFPGADPTGMLVNVYFNPGDDGADMNYGYRGSPVRIDLGFDSTAGVHRYEIDWRPDRLTWLVDGRVVHERVGWDPTPIPHLDMRLHVNLWAPRSSELAGPLDREALPSTAQFSNVAVRS